MIRFARSLVVASPLVLAACRRRRGREGRRRRGARRAASAATVRPSELRLQEPATTGIEVRFEVDHSRAGVAWRVALVHERRVAWKGAVQDDAPRAARSRCGARVPRPPRRRRGHRAGVGPARPRVPSRCHAALDFLPPLPFAVDAGHLPVRRADGVVRRSSFPAPPARTSAGSGTS